MGFSALFFLFVLPEKKSAYRDALSTLLAERRFFVANFVTAGPDEEASAMRLTLEELLARVAVEPAWRTPCRVQVGRLLGFELRRLR